MVIGNVMLTCDNNSGGTSALKANTQQVLVTPPRVLVHHYQGVYEPNE
jgi:hypothetical protein